MPELRNPAPDWITRTRMTTTPKTTQPGHNFWASIVDHPWHAPSCGVSMDGPGSFIHIIGARAQFKPIAPLRLSHLLIAQADPHVLSRLWQVVMHHDEIDRS